VNAYDTRPIVDHREARRVLKRPKKVLHILAGTPGGAALSTIALMSALEGQGIESCVVCGGAGNEASREALLSATHGELLLTPLYWWNKKIRAALWKRPLIEARQLFKTGGGLVSALKIYRFAKERGVDLVHTSTLLTPEGATVARLLGIPHVWHVRELVGQAQPFRFRRELPALGEYLSRYASKVVANSRSTAGHLSPVLPKDHLEVVPNGIDVSRFAARTHSRERNPVVVAMVGGLEATVKKHALFVDAAARVDRSLAVEFRIYGDDPSRHGSAGAGYARGIHERIRARELGSRFTWPGFVPDPARIMSEIDILVQPSDLDSFGRVVVEAMAAAVPVAGVRGGGCVEIVEDGVCGLLAEPEDPARLAACIERLVRDPELRQTLGRAGRERAHEVYSLRSYAEGILGVYERAMAQPLTLQGRRNRTHS
jgi:glycosyltransferase involved in cell wall biosynthesis